MHAVTHSNRGIPDTSADIFGCAIRYRFFLLPPPLLLFPLFPLFFVVGWDASILRSSVRLPLPGGCCCCAEGAEKKARRPKQSGVVIRAFLAGEERARSSGSLFCFGMRSRFCSVRLSLPSSSRDGNYYRLSEVCETQPVWSSDSSACLRAFVIV